MFNEENKEPPKFGEGLIPQLLRKRRLLKRLSKKQQEELKQIEANAYFEEMKKKAIEKGKEMANKE